MRDVWLLRWSFVLVAGVGMAACAMDSGDGDDDYSWADSGGGKADGAGGGEPIASTGLAFDLAAMTGTATISLETDGNVALEVEGLTITSVHDDRGERKYKLSDGKLLVSHVRGDLVVEYGFALQHDANGLLPGGSTVVWPYYCGNLFPCHSQPADGTTFDLALDGIPAADRAVFPAAIPSEAPPYQIAWAVGDYTTVPLGTTDAGTRVSVSYLPGGKTAAMTGTKHLAKIFDWYEKNLGSYSFGQDVGSVSVVWGEGFYGGMEHHPLWHVANDAMNDELTHAHEAAHGWFGDGIRLRCWEDFVLSEGTVSYLAARSIGQISGADAEAAVWREYGGELRSALLAGGAPAWPEGCNKIDIIKDHLFTDIPYMEGAYFYKDVADKVGPEVLDGVLARFYAAHRGQAAGMQDMIDAIQADTGFDPSALVASRLRKKF